MRVCNTGWLMMIVEVLVTFSLNLRVRSGACVVVRAGTPIFYKKL